jgi:hypothetical protein
LRNQLDASYRASLWSIHVRLAPGDLAFSFAANQI